MAAAMPLGDSAPNISVVPRPGLSTSVPSASVTLPYTLYSDKLFENLVKRAQSGDAPVTVELKNQDGHVGMACSPAFFHAVALPALLSLGPRFTKVIDNMLLNKPNDNLPYFDQRCSLIGGPAHMVPFNLK